MPELPEVEIAARVVRACLVGHALERVTVHDPRIVRRQSKAAFRRGALGREVLAVERRGKHLLLMLAGDHAAWVHLGMTGKLVAVGPGARGPAHTRVTFRHDAGGLAFRDPRIFGGVTSGPADAVRESSGWNRLGRDALEIDGSGPKLRTSLAPPTGRGGGRRDIKIALMDQRRLAGVGNIYAAEALFRARISPTATVTSLDANAWGRLARGLRAAMGETLDAHGDGQIAYLNEGGVDNPFLVYAREGEPCGQCGTRIERTVQGGRGTFSCPGCQGDHQMRRGVPDTEIDMKVP